MEIFISTYDIGELAGDGEWTCCTEPADAQASVAKLIEGYTLEEEAIIWTRTREQGGILLRGVKGSWVTTNPSGEKYHLVPPGVRVRMEVAVPLVSVYSGPFFWDIGGGNTYTHSIEGVITIEE